MNATRTHNTRGPCALAAALSLLFLAGFDGCPLSLDNTPPQQQDGGSSVPTLDIGGSKGAYWTITCDKNVTITVRTGTQVASKQAAATAGALSILNNTINLNHFCSRADTLCPAALLPYNTAIIQPSKTPWNPLIGFNRVGPLRIIKKQVGLIGMLNNDSLKVPLATSGLPAAKGDYCALFTPSAINARVLAKAGEGKKADTIEGKITLAYGSDCWNLGGGSAVTAKTTVELTVAFTGKRKQGL